LSFHPSCGVCFFSSPGNKTGCRLGGKSSGFPPFTIKKVVFSWVFYSLCTRQTIFFLKTGFLQYCLPRGRAFSFAQKRHSFPLPRKKDKSKSFGFSFLLLNRFPSPWGDGPLTSSSFPYQGSALLVSSIPPPPLGFGTFKYFPREWGSPSCAFPQRNGCLNLRGRFLAPPRVGLFLDSHLGPWPPSFLQSTGANSPKKLFNLE